MSVTSRTSSADRTSVMFWLIWCCWNHSDERSASVRPALVWMWKNYCQLLTETVELQPDTSESSGPVPAGRSAHSGSEWRNETTWWTRCLYFNDIWWPYSQHVKGSAGFPGQTFTSITVLNQVYTHSYCVANDDSDSVGTSWTSWHHGFKKWPHHTPARLVKKVSSSFYTL